MICARSAVDDVCDVLRCTAHVHSTRAGAARNTCQGSSPTAAFRVGQGSPLAACLGRQANVTL